MALAVEHVALSVTDMSRSLAFYRDLLGLKVVRVIEPHGGNRLGRITGMDGCRARIVHLDSGGAMLELFEYLDPRGRPSAPDRCQADIGLAHVGFKSPDLHRDYERLKSHGVKFLSEPVEFRPGVTVVYFRGPDGEVCELRQIPEEESD
jgi:catechol 2,3-dioxygenase-like lactoylglutathione lyase family enzyme